ncbi:hypothetical protein JL721_8216 [Aureococcus anophagefferens]|nr:hypothetical protein JL721_8216 [Aureococcus anophagefferens]
MVKASLNQDKCFLGGAAARALERRRPATMLSMSGGVVHLTSRLVFCFASAPLVLVKLLRDAPLVPVEGLHADEEAQLIAQVPFYCLLAHVMLFMFSNLPCVFWCAAHGGWDNGPATMKALAGCPHAAHANTMECLPVFLTSIYCAHCLQLEPVFLAKLAVIAITCESYLQQPRAEAPAMEFRKRGLVPLGVAVVVAAAVFLTATRIRSDGDWSTTDLSALYSCSNGDPGVAQAYADGSFEINDVRLNTAVRRARARASQVDCEWFADGEDYWFNITQYEVGDDAGKWRAKDEGKAWSSVFLAGTYKGSKYFGYYFCGPPVAVTERGIAYILKDTAHADTDFHEMIKDKMETMGVLEYGEYEEVAQTDDCAYTWPTAGFRRRER